MLLSMAGAMRVALAKQACRRHLPGDADGVCSQLQTPSSLPRRQWELAAHWVASLGHAGQTGVLCSFVARHSCNHWQLCAPYREPDHSTLRCGFSKSTAGRFC
jgi:hypothetical protein